MKFETVIPEVISINLICELLGLSGMKLDARLDALKSHSQNKDLLFTFHDMVKAMPAEISIGDIYDEDEFIEFRPAKDENIEYIETAKSFILRNYYPDKGKTFTYISNFKESGEVFNIIKADNSDIGIYTIDLASVYVKKSDYINFMKKLRTSSPEIKQPYQDINSQYYSPKLDLAIQLHHAIYIEKFGKVGHRRLSRVAKWLNENRPNEEFSDAGISRFSTIIGITEETG